VEADDSRFKQQILFRAGLERQRRRRPASRSGQADRLAGPGLDWKISAVSEDQAVTFEPILPRPVRRERAGVRVFGSADPFFELMRVPANPHPDPLPAYREREVEPMRDGNKALRERGKKSSLSLIRSDQISLAQHMSLHCLHQRRTTSAGCQVQYTIEGEKLEMVVVRTVALRRRTTGVSNLHP